MTDAEFQYQMGRLIDNFGAQHYKAERLKLILREVSQMSALSFRKVIDKVILECRQAPMIQDMRDEIARQREYEWMNQKRVYKYETEEFFAGSNFSDDDRKMFCQVILKRLNGKLSDGEFDSFVKLLKQSEGRQQ